MSPSAGRPLALLFGGPVVHLADRARYYRVITRRARAGRLIACAAGVAAVWMPPLASLAVLDVTPALVAVVLPRVHGRQAKAPKVTAGGVRP
ncbi:hypothetical protein ABT126_30155 [Streptomyces sp. NPDC002012]|uniref:hypothetical protein n=1 Tax=unclassified Streptomyces TaxID=2593676 RepID=UPI00332B4F65